MKKIARSGITSADSVGKDSAPLDPLPPEVFPPPLELLSVVPDDKNILDSRTNFDDFYLQKTI